jgi:SAM-dependent methyltransferase
MVSNVKDPKVIKANYYDVGYHSTIHKHLLEDDNYFRSRAEAAARLYFGRFERPLGNILEYGCGIGQNIACLENAVGFDVSSEALEACRRRGIPTISNPSDIPVNHFHYVLCRHALEHVEQPLKVIRELLTYLRPDGTLILVLPKEKHSVVPLEPDLNQHLYCWNFRTINNLISRGGGIPVENHYQNVLGYRALLPIRKMFGRSAYYHLTRLVGRVYSISELVVHVRRKLDATLQGGDRSSVSNSGQ